jgi:hypothetical protein
MAVVRLRLAEATMSSSQPSPPVYVILSVVACLEQKSNQGGALIWFLTEKRNLTLPSGSREKIVDFIVPPNT